MAEPVEMPVEMAGEMKKQKLKKNKMTVIPVDLVDLCPAEDGFPPSEELPATQASPCRWAQEDVSHSAASPPVSPSAADAAEAEEVSSPERTEVRDNRWRSKEQSNWQPTLNGPASHWKEGPRAAPAAPAPAAPAAAVAPVERQSWANVQEWQSYDYRNERYSQSSSASNYRNEKYSQSYSSYNSYQGHADSTSSSWKSNNGYYGQSGWWANRPFMSYGDEFDQTVKVTQEGNLVIRLSNRKLDEEAMRRFCSWLPKYMQRLRTQESRLTKRQGCLLAKELDASKNFINHTALKMLLTVLKEERIVVGVLNLHHNRLTRPAAGMLAIWIRTAPWALYELHLSHNEIDTEGALEIIEAVARAERYPTDRPGSSFRIPLWLRMEHNSIQESFVARAEEIFRSHRPVCDGPHICWMAGAGGVGENQCKNGYCEQSVGQKCPVVHLPYLTQRFRLSRQAPSWSERPKMQQDFVRPTPEVQESFSSAASKPPWVEVDHVPQEPKQTWRVKPQPSTDPPEIEEDESPWCKGRPEEAAAETAPLSTDPPEIEESDPEDGTLRRSKAELQEARPAEEIRGPEPKEASPVEPSVEETKASVEASPVEPSVEETKASVEASPVEPSVEETKASVEGWPAACEPRSQPVEAASPPEAEAQALGRAPDAPNAPQEAEARRAGANEVIPLPDAAPEDLPLPKEMFYQEEQNDGPWWEPPAEDEPDEVSLPMSEPELPVEPPATEQAEDDGPGEDSRRVEEIEEKGSDASPKERTEFF